MRRRVLTGAAVCAFLATASAAFGSPAVHHRLDSDGARGYWTEKRMSRAIPAGTPAADAPAAMRAARLAARRAPFYISEPVPDPSVAPYPAVGKVFFRLGRYSYVCSAAIVDAPSARLVWTASHCLRDPGPRGRWASKWIFVPAYQQGQRPYGSWPAAVLWTSRGWLNRNDNMDFGAVQIARSRGTGVETAVGLGLPFEAGQPVEQDWQAIGYPADGYFDDALWHCQSPFAGSDPSFHKSGPLPFAIGCDMGGGSSGGPWISASTGAIGAVTAYGYNNEPDLLFGTNLGSQAAALYQRAATR
jgi:V8-like Glu-specific endopeptidase